MEGKRYKHDVKNGEDLSGRRRKHGRESIGSVGFHPEALENRKEAEREA